MATAEKVVKDRIAFIGVELEGGWTQAPKLGVQRDGSVDFANIKAPRAMTHPENLYMMNDKERNAMRAELEKWKLMNIPQYVGEIPSPKLSRKDLDPFMRDNYPQIINDTCGLHVHMSFHFLINYQRLMCPDFTGEMVKGLLGFAEQEKLAKSHPLWARLKKPDHPHCAHTYCGDAQSKSKKKDYHSRGMAHSRYTAINYCFEQHRTVEVRLLSMMEGHEQGIRAVNSVLDITNRFLAKQRTRESKIVSRVPRSGSVSQSHRIFV